MTPTPEIPPAFARLLDRGFELAFASHSKSILTNEFLDAASQLEDILLSLDLPITEIIGSGGGETKFTQRLRRLLSRHGWSKHRFLIEKRVDGAERQSISHEVDHVFRSENGVLALEIEWNNKDAFFDRDLDNFKRLHSEGAISIGILITRGSSLQDGLWEAVRRFAQERAIGSFEDLERHGYRPTPRQRENVMRRVERERKAVLFADAWTDNFVANKYGQATTHWSKLMDRIHRGVGNPCPLVLVGLPRELVRFDSGQVDVLDGNES